MVFALYFQTLKSHVRLPEIKKLANLVMLPLVCVMAASQPVQSADAETRLVVVSIDGLRSEELFSGAEKALMSKEHGVDNVKRLESDYWREAPETRRKALLPFLWSKFESDQGWVCGDLTRDSVVVIENRRYFSYPGYNEFLTGFGDYSVDSNDKKYNQNVTFLEWLNAKEKYKGKVAAFASWDVFPFIINDKRSGVYVNAGWQPFTIGEPRVVEALNLVSDTMFQQFETVRYDSLTTAGAIEYLKTEKPKVLYLSIGEVDDWAHAGRYDRYLNAARHSDSLIERLWNTCESMPEYQGKTIFLLTTDHGRGLIRDGWKNHSDSLPGSERAWFAAFGPGLAAKGIDEGGAFTLSQLAPTACALLGEQFEASVGEKRHPLPIAPGTSHAATPDVGLGQKSDVD